MVSSEGFADPVRNADWAGYAPLDAPPAIRARAAVADIRDGFRTWRSWSYLALETIKNQYRRTVLGPWWLTLQTTAYVLGLSVVFSHLLKTGTKAFLPYVAIGFIGFSLLSGLTRAASVSFVSAADTMRSTRQPLSSYILRDVTIEFIQFGHNMLIYVVFLASGLVPIRPEILIAIPVIALIAINGLFAALWLGPTVARYRDVGPLVLSLLQVLVFFTPIFYRIQDLGHGDRTELLDWNPFTYLLGAFRAPLIGEHLRSIDLVGSIVVTGLNIAVGLIVFSRARSRVPYWVA